MDKRINFVSKYFWFLKNRAGDLDMEKDRNAIIHQTLALGSMNDVRKIIDIYGEGVTKEEFEKPVKGLYHPAVLEFFEFLLKTKVDKSKYLKDINGKFTF